MKLNVGPGPHYAGMGWVNMDIEGAHFKRDLTGDLLNLPPNVTGLTAVYLGHVLEHIDIELLPTALRTLRDRMVPGATVAVVGPDVQRAQVMYEQGLIPLELLNTCRQHDNPEPGGSHLWDCTEAKVVELLTQAGFRDVRAVDIAHSYELSIFPVVSRVEWQCAVLAESPPLKAKMTAQPTASRTRSRHTAKTRPTAK